MRNRPTPILPELLAELGVLGRSVQDLGSEGRPRVLHRLPPRVPHLLRWSSSSLWPPPSAIDGATLALLPTSTGDPLVIPVLNRDGDILSTLVVQLFDSPASAASTLLRFNYGFRLRVVRAQAPLCTVRRRDSQDVQQAAVQAESQV